MLKYFGFLLLLEIVLIRSENVSIENGQIVGNLMKNENGQFVVQNFGNFSYIVRIIVENVVCVGSIIEPDVILTAAHCVVEKDPEEAIVIGGIMTTFLPETAMQVVQAKKFVTHPNFNRISPYGLNDIALIFLKNSFNITDYVKPIKLENKVDNVLGNKGELAGWGVDSIGNYSQWLRKFNLIVVENSKCEIYKHIKLSSDMICAKVQGNGTPCVGDSGAPLVYNDKVLGVLSFGRGLKQLSNGKNICDANIPNVLTKVPNYSFWIRTILKKTQRN